MSRERIKNTKTRQSHWNIFANQERLADLPNLYIEAKRGRVHEGGAEDDPYLNLIAPKEASTKLITHTRINLRKCQRRACKSALNTALPPGLNKVAPCCLLVLVLCAACVRHKKWFLHVDSLGPSSPRRGKTIE